LLRSNPDSDRGSASVIAAAMMTLLMVLAGAGVMVGSAVTARHRAQAAADLAALAGAGQVASGQSAACASAASVARAMQAGVATCTVDGLDVVVTIEVPVRLGRLGIQAAHAAARAGPVEVGG
jgi:secretion/DNA translocation related TadE-like protein